MFSKREAEGYFEIDHRESPGFTPEEAAAAGLRGLPVGKGSRFQAPTYQCHGCEKHVILNPLRTRERTYCQVHDGYLCDMCTARRAARGYCKSFAQVLDEFAEKVVRGQI